MQTSDINQKIELWGMTDIENELGEITREPRKIKNVWAKIIPRHGKPSTIVGTVEEVVLDVIIRCRVLSIKNPSINMYFMRKGIKYEVFDFIEDMKNKEFIEFYCKIIYE